VSLSTKQKLVSYLLLTVVTAAIYSRVAPSVCRI
jgi:hypothetical protein